MASFAEDGDTFNYTDSDSGMQYLCEVTNDELGEVYIAAGEDCVFEGDIKLPAYVYDEGNRKYVVDGLADDAFNCDYHDTCGIHGVFIPASVYNIGNRCFAYIGDLEYVKFEEGSQVRTINNGAFMQCNALSSINLPETLTDICDAAFDQCCSLQSIDIPKEVVYIGSRAFRECTDLASIKLPDNLDVLGDEVFDICDHIGGIIHIPEGLSEIGESVFSNCPNIQGFTGKYATKDGRMLIVDNEVEAVACGGLVSLAIPEGVTRLESGLFEECGTLESVTLPSSVKAIDDRCFAFCYKLKSINLPEGLETLGEGCFSGCQSLYTLELPSTLKSIGKGCFRYGYLISINLPDGLKEIPDNAFYGSSMLENVVFPRNLVKVGEHAFRSCNALTSVVFENIETIGSGAFYQCKSLAHIDIPASIKKISPYAFGSVALESVIIRDEHANFTADITCFSSATRGNGTLYVPAGTKDRYKKAFTGCFSRVQVIGSADLVNGEEYAGTEDVTGVDITYARTFDDTEWQALYVPFDLAYEEWSDYMEVAELKGVSERDDNKDGEIEEVVVEFKSLTDGDKLTPNVPYLARAKKAGSFTIEAEEKTLLAAPETDGNVECKSANLDVILYGVYHKKDDMHESGPYALAKGDTFEQAQAGVDELEPNGIYLTIRDLYGPTKAQARKAETNNNTTAYAPRTVRFVVGDASGVTTEIASIEVDNTVADNVYYDLSGRRVANPRNGQVYIFNGRKVLK